MPRKTIDLIPDHIPLFLIFSQLGLLIAVVCGWKVLAALGLGVVSWWAYLFSTVGMWAVVYGLWTFPLALIGPLVGWVLRAIWKEIKRESSRS
jgi:hypothetical protein